METAEHSTPSGVEAPAAPAPEAAPVVTEPSPPVNDAGADAFRKAMGSEPAAPTETAADAAAPAAPEGDPVPEQTELELSDESFTEFLSKELPLTEAAPDPAVKPESLSDDDWTDLQLLRSMRQKDESTSQQLADARARILGEVPRFEVTEDAFKAALDGDAATFGNVMNSAVAAGAEHAVQAMLGQIAPYMENVQKQYSTMIYESVKDMFCSTVPGADKMRGNQHFERAIAHVAKAAPDTGIVQALHKAMELTNRAYADAEAVRKGGGKMHDVRPAGAAGGVQGGVRQGAAQDHEPTVEELRIAHAFGLDVNELRKRK